jgi:hypothetical protein
MLAADTEVILRNPETNEETIAVVMGRMREEGAAHVYSLVLLDPSANLWHIKFPVTDSHRIILLACDMCHEASEHALSEKEFELIETARELRRLCKHCNSITIWREPSSAEAPKVADVQTKQKPIPISTSAPKAGAPIEDRRKNRRTQFAMTACVRYSSVQEVVKCEDISKGGFRFTCDKRFPEGTQVEVAVPYEDSVINIFSPAIIKYCLPMPKGKFRHGVAHVKKSGPNYWDS